MGGKAKSLKDGPDENSAFILGAFDDCIDRYMTSRRALVPEFVDRHFSFQETYALQKKSVLLDMLSHPLNALWSIPYLSLKKIAEVFEKTEWEKQTHPLGKVPSGVKTRYQFDVEKMVLSEVLDAEAFMKDLKNYPGLLESLATRKISLENLHIEATFKKHVAKYTTHQAVISDVISTLLTFATGWAFFGDRSIGVLGMGDRIARSFARDRAASDFFLGKEIGSGFYSIFPPQPTGFQLVVATAAVGFLLTLISVFASFMSDPVRKQFGLHRKKLGNLIEDLEDALIVQVRKAVRKSESTASR